MKKYISCISVASLLALSISSAQAGLCSGDAVSVTNISNMTPETVAYFPATAALITTVISAGTTAANTANQNLLLRISDGPSTTVQTLIQTSTGLIQEEIKALGKLSSKAAENQTLNDGNIQKAVARREVLNNITPAPDTCATWTMASASSAQTKGKAAAVAIANEAASWRAKSGRRSSSATASSDVVEKSRAYCDKKTAPGGECPGKGESLGDGTKDDKPMLDADKEATSLLYGANNASQDKLTYTQNQVQAAEVFIANVTDGAEAPTRLDGEDLSSPASKAYMAKLIEFDAMMDAARMPLNSILASRKPLPESSKLVDNLRSQVDDGGFVAKQLDELKAHTKQSQISPADLMRIEVLRRSDNVEWMSKIQGMESEVPLLKELVLMTALSLKMQYLHHMDAEPLTITQSMQSASAARKLLPEMAELHKAIVTDTSR